MIILAVIMISLKAPLQSADKELKEIISISIEKPSEELGLGASQTWDCKDEDKLLDIMADSRNGNHERFFKLIDDSIDVFHGVVPKEPDYLRTTPVPKTVSIDFNVITHPGITLTNKNITGEDMTRFLYVISGRGNTEIPTIHSDHVEDENARVSILDTGTLFTSGTAIMQAAIFPTTIEDAVVKSFGSATHNSPEEFGYTTFWVSRILDSSKYVNHFKGKTTYSHLHVVDRRSRLSE